ncbi:hypothetical protein LA2_03590 [Lactobacillus amylovorus GRL 1112]|uniref:Transposase n=2 Tax=Lactobacillus amylovorus TaxID=1604 RepID=E4SN49_LACAR|nr:hypothetical protein LA2_03590 [Lactobacillus amylovorus GRL 1112]
MHAFRTLQKQYSEHWNDIFKTSLILKPGAIHCRERS